MGPVPGVRSGLLSQPTAACSTYRGATHFVRQSGVTNDYRSIRGETLLGEVVFYLTGANVRDAGLKGPGDPECQNPPEDEEAEEHPRELAEDAVTGDNREDHQ